MKSILDNRGIDTKDCTEKQDIIQKIAKLYYLKYNSDGNEPNNNNNDIASNQRSDQLDRENTTNNSNGKERSYGGANIKPYFYDNLPDIDNNSYKFHDFSLDLLSNEEHDQIAHSHPSPTLPVERGKDISQLSHLNVRELKQLLTSKGIDTKDCLEKDDLIRKYQSGVS